MQNKFIKKCITRLFSRFYSLFLVLFSCESWGKNKQTYGEKYKGFSEELSGLFSRKELLSLAK